MKQLLMLTLGVALTVAACGTSASDAVDMPPDSGAGSALQPAAGADAPTQRSAARADAPTPRPAPRAAAQAPARVLYRDVTIPAGTSLPLSLTSSIASDTSAVEDAVTAEITRPITVDGLEVLPVGTRLAGIVTVADDAGHVKGRANIAFRFTSLQVGDTRYDLATAQSSYMAPATKSEDATKIGIGAGAGAIIGGLLGGKDGAAKGAVVGGGAGTGVVLATRGKEMRLGPGAAVTTQLTAPLTVRIRG
jgi:hypothetical protein